MSQFAPQVFKARWLLPVEGEPIDGGAITVQNGRILAVGAHEPGTPAQDLGDVAILPGLVNAHTHLEFSDLETPLGERGMSLPDWIRLVIARRLRDSSLERAERASARGLEESQTCGVVALGEIATSGWAADAQPPGDVTAFLELIGISSERSAERLAAAEQFLSPADRKFRPGLSPHAPYSVHPDLLAGAIALAKWHNAPLAMHLAESREELELLRTGGGPFRTLLEDLNVWNPAGFRPGSRPLEFLEQLAQAPRSLVIHGNYLDREELAYAAAHRDTMSVVYCPRTHDFFGHSPYPLAEMVVSGVAVALGTDSRGSNPNLSLWEELQFVAARHPSVSPRRMLELGTLAGARALGIDCDLGSLVPGKRADFIAVDLPDQGLGDPYETIFAAARSSVVHCLHTRS